MNDETIVAVYDTAAHADAAVADLTSMGIPDNAITRHAGGASGTSGAGTSGTMTSGAGTEHREQGFWSRLFGGEPDHDTSVYDRSMQGGSTVVTVKVSEQHVPRVMDILDRHNPIDIDERASGYGLSQTSSGTGLGSAGMASTGMGSTGTGLAGDVGYAASGASGAGSYAEGATAGAYAASTGTDETIRLSEERLAVGKRLVNRGGTRVRRFVVETPVEEQVSLHEERVTLERRPVTESRSVGDADFTEKTIEMTETAEEAVVAKTAYVTEEIRLRKESTDRVETVRDTVRREDVEIEQIPGGQSATTTTTTTPGIGAGYGGGAGSMAGSTSKI